MVAAETDLFYLRFWFSLQSREATVKKFRAVRKIRVQINKIGPENIKGVEEVILKMLTPADQCAAYEILDTNRNGIVGYIEWP